MKKYNLNRNIFTKHGHTNLKLISLGNLDSLLSNGIFTH